VTAAKLNTILLFAASLLGALALITLVPAGGSKLSDLGYHSLCPFAPWSTLALAVPAGLALLIRQYLRDQARREQVKREATSRS
jgi:hypothetical protein